MMQKMCDEQGLEYVFWDADRIAEHPAAERAVGLCDRKGVKDIRVSVDLLRMWAISTYGGIWMDLDILPLIPLSSMVGRSGWVCAHAGERGSTLVTQQALFGLPAGNPVTRWLSQHAVEQLQSGVRNAHFIAGPRAFRLAENAFPGAVEHFNMMALSKNTEHRRRVNSGDLGQDILDAYLDYWFVSLDPVQERS